MDVNLPYVNLVFPVDKYDDRLLRCFSSFLTYFKYRKIDNWIVVGNLNDKEEYIIKDYSYKYGIRNLHVIKTECTKSYEELSKIGISFGFINNEICYVSDFKTEITKEFNPGVLINILNSDPNVKSIRFTGKDYKKIGKCNYKILNLTDRFSYDGNYLIKNGSGNDLIVDFKVDGIKSIEIKQIIKEEPKKPVIEQIPYVTVVMTTHNRTNVACAVIDSLVKNLKYPKLKWCISDDRSDEGHVDKLVEQFKKNGINEVHVEKTNKERYGLGASLNNGLRYAWTNSDIVLTTEDDWILEKELKLAHYVDIINKNNDIGGIRLATMNYAIANRRSGHNGFYIVESDGKYKTSVFNNQVMLRHKRTYDRIGYYEENCSGDVSEIDEIKKFNNQKGLAVLYPVFIKQNCMDDSSMYFMHVGKSVSGHERYEVPERYKWIYDENRDLPYVTVVMTTHNRTNVACAVIDSLVKNIKYPKLKWCISDDRSDEGHIWSLVDQFNKNNIYDIKILYTDNKHYGLGASLNNGLRYAWTNSDIVLTTEDDMLLTSVLNLEKYVNILNNDTNVCGIRFGQIDSIFKKFKKKYNDITYSIQYHNMDNPFIFNNQIMLRHKRIYDILGYYKENIHSDEQEYDMVKRYNKLTCKGNSNKYKVLWPIEIPIGTFKSVTGLFKHIGLSSKDTNEKQTIDKEYLKLNNIDNDILTRKNHICNVCIATYKPRINNLNNIIRKMLPQCDNMYICLNGYSDIPNFLIRNQKIKYFLAGDGQKHKDLGCNNKMMWIDDVSGYYLSIDDDIDYPDDYTYKMIQNINKYNKRCICSYHGQIFNIKNGKLINPKTNRKTIHFQNGIENDVFLDVAGGGVSGFHPKTIGINANIFLSQGKNSGDDEILALWCQKHNKTIVRPACPPMWIKINKSNAFIHALYLNDQSVSKRINKLQEYTKWEHHTIYEN